MVRVALAFVEFLCYAWNGATSNGRRFPCFSGVIFFAPDPKEKGVIGMITWTELFAFGMFVIALISLIVQIIEKKK